MNDNDDSSERYEGLLFIRYWVNNLYLLFRIIFIVFL